MSEREEAEARNFDRWHAGFFPRLKRRRFLAHLDESVAALRASPASALMRTDSVIRRRWLSDPAALPGFLSVRPRDVRPLVRESSDSTFAAGLLSMHPSGYVRQAAIEQLRRDSDAAALRFLILRCADWVAEVRRVSVSAASDRIDSAPLVALVDCLPIVHALERKRRGEEVAARVQRRISAVGSTPELQRLVRHGEVAAARTAGRVLVDRGVALEAVDDALKQGDPVTQRIVCDGALAQVAPQEREALLRRLVTASSVMVAEGAMWTLLNELPNATSVAIANLTNPRRALRMLARRFLEGNAFDVSAFYENLLATDAVGALRGLGDSPARLPLAALSPYLDDENARVRRAAVNAIVSAGDRELVVPCLADDDARVALAAGRRLARVGTSPAASAWIAGAIATDDRDFVLRACFTAARGMGRWSRLVVALQAIAGPRDIARNRGIEFLDHTLDGWSRAFTGPSAAEREALTALLARVSSRLDRPRLERLEFAVAPFFTAT